MSELICEVCMHHCHLNDGQLGRCRARKNEDGHNVCANYGRITSIAMDPIEKKPLIHFHPGSYILSVGSYGCNLSCPFCQNASISMADEETSEYRTMSARQLADIAIHQKYNLGIAFTYNEPLISYEYIIDVAKILKRHHMQVVLVTNGTASRQVLEKVMPYVDAMNIDLKGDESFYHELGGDYKTVRDTIAYVYSRCHLEVTILVIPGKNDTPEFIGEQAEWLASLDSEIVLHLSRYFPRYHYTLPPTDIDQLVLLQQEAQKYLKYVSIGNV